MVLFKLTLNGTLIFYVAAAIVKLNLSRVLKPHRQVLFFLILLEIFLFTSDHT